MPRIPISLEINFSALAFMLALTAGCGDRNQLAEKDTPSQMAESAIPEPALALGEGFTYDASMTCSPLTDENIANFTMLPKDEALRAKWVKLCQRILTDQAPVGAIVLGDRVRIYNVTGRWRPATFEILNEDEVVQASLRMDLPPSGRVTGPLPGGLDPLEQVVKMRLTMPTMETSDGSISALHDREIGTQSAQFTSDMVRELGWAPTSELNDAEAWIAADETVKDMAEKNPDASIRAESWSVEIKATTTSISGESWQALVLGETHSTMASYGGGDSVEPPEEWWLLRVVNLIDDESATLGTDH